MSITCSLFGHRNTPSDLRPRLYTEVERHILKLNATNFYVGRNGAFDQMAAGVLRELKVRYPQIRSYSIQAYLPTEEDEYGAEMYDDTIYPEGLELVPKRFAISRRNRWMIERSDYVIVYVRTNYGGAYAALQYAKAKGKAVTNLADGQHSTNRNP
ncbi:MAG: hypothetical protein LBN00_11630 [Oscillospiraceae bacterium]|jgi:uncharacterized phage-like protein YoqJ|nr:hypothetical protein [Oscillospiraceae bacterium]